MEQEQTKLERLRLAYARVFGVDKARNEDQALVWDNMLSRSYISRSTIVPDKEGKACKIRMECAEGMRIFMLDTINFIEQSVKPAKKPKIKQNNDNERTDSI